MYWLIVFIVSWILFFIMVDYKMLKCTIWSGIFTMLIEVSIDIYYTKLGLYKSFDGIFDVFGVSIFFILGPPLVIGTLMGQYYPKKKLYRIANIVIISILFYSQEYMFLKVGSLKYYNWSWVGSIVIDMLALMSVRWFNIVIFEKESN